MSKVVCVLYEDPVDGYPKSYPRDDIPKFDDYPDGQTLPTPKAIDFKPGALLGSVSGELGLRKFLETQGHTLVVTSDTARIPLSTRSYPTPRSSSRSPSGRPT
jgi:formate dehydrogenase